MLKSDAKVGGWFKRGQNHDDVSLEWSLSNRTTDLNIFGIERKILYVARNPLRCLYMFTTPYTI